MLKKSDIFGVELNAYASAIVQRTQSNSKLDLLLFLKKLSLNLLRFPNLEPIHNMSFCVVYGI